MTKRRRSTEPGYVHRVVGQLDLELTLMWATEALSSDDAVAMSGLLQRLRHDPDGGNLPLDDEDKRLMTRFREVVKAAAAVGEMASSYGRSIPAHPADLYCPTFFGLFYVRVDGHPHRREVSTNYGAEGAAVRHIPSCDTCVRLMDAVLGRDWSPEDLGLTSESEPWQWRRFRSWD